MPGKDEEYTFSFSLHPTQEVQPPKFGVTVDFDEVNGSPIVRIDSNMLNPGDVERALATALEAIDVWWRSGDAVRDGADPDDRDPALRDKAWTPWSDDA